MESGFNPYSKTKLPDEMKAISLWQPWAMLWAYRIKLFETRSWATSYRGPIAIHAAAKDPRTLGLYTNEILRMESALSAAGFFPHDINSLPRGCILATAELVACHRIVLHGGRGLSSTSPGWLELDDGIYEPDDQEAAFGDWTPGRYAWEIANVNVLVNPIPAKGSQGLWTWRRPA